LLVLVLSDFHVGKGRFLDDGASNLLEDFEEDERFFEFLDFYSSGTHYFSDVTLVLNGDIFNFIQMDVKGKFHHYHTEEDIISMLDEIIKGHPLFVEALKKFASRPNKHISFVIGNHDLGMVFKGAQARLNKAVGRDINFTHNFDQFGVWVEHGHRFEAINTVPRKQSIILGPEGKEIVNYPWASLFCIYLLPKLKDMRPYIDKVRPLSAYVKWLIFNDIKFAFYLCWAVITYCIRTQFKPYGKYNKNFKISLKQVLNIAIHPTFEKNAQKVLKRRKDLNVVIMGHTHVTEWRKFKDGRLYFNTGTWNEVPSVDAAMHKSVMNLTYVAIDVNEKNHEVKKALLNVWKGKWRPYREEVVANCLI